MVIRKIIPLSLVLAIITSVFLSSAAFAGTSYDEMMLKIAAGELPYESEIKESDVKIKKDQAVEIAKSIIENADSYYLGYANLSPGWNDRNAMWSLDFYTNSDPQEHININIDADTGEIFYFSYGQGYYSSDDVFIAKYTWDEAKSIAEKFLKNVMKLNLESFELRDADNNLYYRTGGVKERIIYDFYYIRKVNNVVFPYSSISISVDGTDGKVTNYQINTFDTDSIEFPKPEKIISEEEALENYKKSVQFDLQYVLTYDRTPYIYPNQKVILAYIPTNISYIMADATTGKPLNYDGTELESFPDVAAQSEPNAVPLDPNAKEPKGKSISEEEAYTIALEYKKKVEEMLGMKFDEYTGYNPYYWDNYSKTWQFNWNKYSDGKNIYLNMSISKDTGLVRNFYIGNYNYEYERRLKEGEVTEDIVEKVSWKQGKERALELIKKLFPEQYGLYSDQNQKAPELDEYARKYMMEYSYSFTRVVNGLKYNNDSIYIGIDRTTGELRSFSFNWSDLEFPEVKDIIPVEKAKELYFDSMAAELNYYVNVTYDENGNQIYSDKAKLVYQLVNKESRYVSVLIDAVKGKLVDWSGSEITAGPSKKLSDLEPHWAKRSVELLMTQGILVKPDFNYDETVTRKEAVKMMALAKGIDYTMTLDIKPTFKDVDAKDPYFVYVESAVKNNIIAPSAKKFNGDEKITKGEFVELFTNLMGYGEIAKYSEIYKLPDSVRISEEKAGYAAVCYALDLLPVSEGEAFDGEEEVTYGEAAVALYKALKYIK